MASAEAATGAAAESSERPHDVVVFTRAGCSYCAKAKALLSSRGVRIGIVDVGLEPSRRAEVAELSGATTVPQVFVGRRCLGGFDDLGRLDDVGELRAALERRAEDGPDIATTPEELLRKGAGLPPELQAKLDARAKELRPLSYAAGSQPSIRAFLLYGISGKPAQDQRGNVPLNLSAAPGEPERPAILSSLGAAELAALLRKTMLQLLDAFNDPRTGNVDYMRMKGSREWALFRAVAAELGYPRLAGELKALGEADRKAFFINLYNAMTFHGVITFGRRPGWWYLYCFFITPAVSYRLAGVQVSLDDVEHGLLRAMPGYFQRGEQELQRLTRMPKVDPRIHMALNCGARGCPAIAVYNGGALDSELDEAVASFLASESNIRVIGGPEAEAKIELSSLFKMYFEDFTDERAKQGSAEGNSALLSWVMNHARGPTLEQLAALLNSTASPRIDWIPYNWETNGTEVPLDSRIYKPTF